MPVAALETGLYSKLSTDNDLIEELGGTAIYNKQAPQSPGSAYVVFGWQGGGDENESPRRLRNVLYQIKGIARRQSTAASIDSKLDAALHLQTLTVSGFSNIWMAREGDINYVEQDSGGVTWYHVGGMYRILIDG